MARIGYKHQADIINPKKVDHVLPGKYILYAISVDKAKPQGFL